MIPSGFSLSVLMVACTIGFAGAAALPEDFLLFPGVKCDGDLNKKLEIFEPVLNRARCVQKCSQSDKCKAMSYETETRRCKLYETCRNFLTEKDGYDSAILSRVLRISRAKFWVSVRGNSCGRKTDTDCMDFTIGKSLKKTSRQCAKECIENEECEAYQFMVDTTLCKLYRQMTREEREASLDQDSVVSKPARRAGPANDSKTAARRKNPSSDWWQAMNGLDKTAP